MATTRANSRGWSALRRTVKYPLTLIGAALTGLSAFVATGYATQGPYHDGGVGAGTVFCGPNNNLAPNGCDSKTRDGWASWTTGFAGYTGAYNYVLGGYEGYQGGTGGYGQWSTYSNVFAYCGNNSSNQHYMYCWTNNL